MSSPASHAAEPDNAALAPVSRTLARFAREIRHGDIPAPVRERAKHLILDAVGIAIAASRYPFAASMLEGLQTLAATNGAGDGTHTVIALPARLGLRDAVTMNAALVHGIDFDDTHMASVVHATAVAFPPAFSVGESVGASGKDLLTAYVLGMETAIRIGLAANFGFHHHGYHATGVVGHFSSALVAGRLLGLDENQLTAAQGMMGSTAMASQEFVETGAWNKRLHPGWAAVAGITAAHLARSGFVAPDRPYEGRYGIFNMHLGESAGEADLDALTAALGERWETVNAAIKPYPTCHFTHALADSALILRERHRLALHEIARVRAIMPAGVIPVIAEPLANKCRPASEYDAKFSAQFIVATCLARGRFGLAELEAEARADEAVLDLAARVHCAADPDSEFPRYFSGGLVITTRDGRELVHHERINRGAGERALTNDEIVAKFTDNAIRGGSQASAAAVRDAVLDLDRHDARHLAAALAPVS